MIKYNDKIKKGKLGVNYVTDIVDRCDCYFNKIEQENDMGIDAIIEFTENRIPIGKCIAVQIKTGESYVNRRKNECIIPIENHYEYWKNYCMPVYGIVYILNDNVAYWVDIKQYLNENRINIESGKLNIIKFKIKSINKFDMESFNKYFKCDVKNTLPEISYEEASNLLETENIDEIYIGVNSLAKRYAYKKETWDKLIDVFRKTTDYDLISEIIFYLSYIPGHGDLWGQLNFSKETREYARDIINKLNINEVIKILNVIDENGIERGTIGQCVEAIIASIDNSDKLLKEIIKNEDLEEETINSAITIFAYNYPEEFNLAISKNEIKRNWYVELIMESFEEYGGFDLY
ncbi:DUF4365 domain-containing protein [Clostridium sp. MSJ-4]|uniref:DUF4365 domain-containing protein n=1 Tax=Clostridium simiarum TaxID=2841506 RepID=A0ABS6F3N1_9CLOT|nr:DUF4365 domain-containing protein [Clostridium simiarum]MBU5593089.1 DUF4365 domain-containing protein [Clostridium simiarum]